MPTFLRSLDRPALFTKLLASSLFFILGQPLAAAQTSNQSAPLIPLMLYLLDDHEPAPTTPTSSIPYRIPDSGLLIGANYPEGINDTCTGVVIAQQTCSLGLDATSNDDSDGIAGLSYTKLDEDGDDLPASAQNWSCVRDNITGFIWEVKTDDGGLRDKDNTYFWGGITADGRGHPEAKGEYYDDWNPLVNIANSEALCGYDDWRVPAIKELMSLADNGRTSAPAIDTNYFPNTKSYRYWSSTPRSPDSNDTEQIGRAYRAGFSATDNVDRTWFRSGQYSHHHVRLMRSDDYHTYTQ